MNKSDLVDAIATATNEGKSKVAGLLEAVLDHISGALQKGDKVTLPGFGTFETRRREARSGRNPRTGAPVKIAATTAPVFKAGATLKGSVAGKKAAAKLGAKSKASARAKASPKAAAKTPAKAPPKAPSREAEGTLQGSREGSRQDPSREAEGSLQGPGQGNLDQRQEW